MFFYNMCNDLITKIEIPYAGCLIIPFCFRITFMIFFIYTFLLIINII